MSKKHNIIKNENNLFKNLRKFKLICDDVFKIICKTSNKKNINKILTDMKQIDLNELKKHIYETKNNEFIDSIIDYFSGFNNVENNFIYGDFIIKCDEKVFHQKLANMWNYYNDEIWLDESPMDNFGNIQHFKECVDHEPLYINLEFNLNDILNNCSIKLIDNTLHIQSLKLRKEFNDTKIYNFYTDLKDTFSNIRDNIIDTMQSDDNPYPLFYESYDVNTLLDLIFDIIDCIDFKKSYEYHSLDEDKQAIYIEMLQTQNKLKELESKLK